MAGDLTQVPVDSGISSSSSNHLMGHLCPPNVEICKKLL